MDQQTANTSLFKLKVAILKYIGLYLDLIEYEAEYKTRNPVTLNICI